MKWAKNLMAELRRKILRIRLFFKDFQTIIHRMFTIHTLCNLIFFNFISFRFKLRIYSSLLITSHLIFFVQRKSTFQKWWETFSSSFVSNNMYDLINHHKYAEIWLVWCYTTINGVYKWSYSVQIFSIHSISCFAANCLFKVSF